jgi:hypothetical protein
MSPYERGTERVSIDGMKANTNQGGDEMRTKGLRRAIEAMKAMDTATRQKTPALVVKGRLTPLGRRVGASITTMATGRPTIDGGA